MAKTKRVRVKIIKMLQQHGELDTASIYNMLNMSKGDFSMRHGVSMLELYPELACESTNSWKLGMTRLAS
jgi:hypothetical protein